MGAATMTDDIGPAGHVIEHPVHEPGAVHPEGPVGTGGGAARRRHLPERSPAVVPAQLQRFSAPEVVDLAHQLAGGPDHRPALRGQVRGQCGQQIPGRLIGDGQVPGQGGEQVPIGQQLVQGLVLLCGKAVKHPHIVRCPGGDGDSQDGLRPGCRRAAGRVLHGLFFAGELRHVPEHYTQGSDLGCVQHSQTTASICPRLLGGKHRQHLRPGRRCAGDLQAVTAGIQTHLLQPLRQFSIDPGHDGGRGIGARAAPTAGEQDAQG